MDRARATEGSTLQIEFDVLDQDSAVVADTALTGATLTLYDLDTYANTSPVQGILNDRLEQDVLDTNNVTISSQGHVTWTVQPEDNVIVTARRQVERHRAQFRFTWAEGEFRYEVELEVANLRMGS